MIYPENIVSGWYYLSNLEDTNQLNSEASLLQKKVSFIPAEYQTYYQWYLDYFKSYERFPSWEQFKQTAQMENDIKLSLREAKLLHEKNLALWESDSLCDRMKSLPLVERRPLLDRQAQVLQSEVSEAKPVLSDSSFDIMGTMIKTENDKQADFKFPIKKLNEQTHIRPGVTVSILAAPGQGKTQMMENLAYINSVEGEHNTLYVYLENLPQAYMADLLARYSFSSGARVENASLKDGVYEEDASAVKVITDLKKSYDDTKRGQIYFKPFSDYPTGDPLQLGTALANDVNRYNIDVICLDYLQRCKIFAPLRVDAMTYLNQVMSTFSQVALGGFGAKHPSVVAVGVQPNRDAINKAERTRGKYNLSAIAECSAVERDSFLILSLYASAENKAASELCYMVIKNRDGNVDVSPNITPCMYQYAYIGDLVSGTDSNPYTNEAMDALFDFDVDL